MAIHVSLYHRTHYAYDRPTIHAPHVVRLRPAPHTRTKVLSYSQRIIGGEPFLNWQQDPFANWNARLVFPEPLTEFGVEVELVVEMAVLNPFDFFLEESASIFPFKYEAGISLDLKPFLAAEPATPLLEAVVEEFRKNPVSPAKTPAAGARTIDFIVAVNQRVQGLVSYLIRLEPGVQSPEETLTKKSGSCRDSAWLLVHLFRHLGLAARFVSGYLVQLTSDQKSLDGPSGPAADFTDLHAWCEVYLPGAGWIGLDPTSGLLAGEGHIPLSCTPEPSTAAPVTGATGKCEVKFHHEMKVTRIFESPRVTKPYTDAQWQRVNALGQAIDADLQRHDVRLTMGGEPTFISLDDPDGPEWNYIAASARKRELSAALLHRLQAEWAPGALLHYGQGKWYPGEQLPRWALAAYWRKDGEPIWHDPKLIADERRNYGHGAPQAKAFGTRLAELLGVDSRWILPGYEDVFYYTWKERRLPANVTPENSRLKDALERDRIARIFQKGLGEIVGYALPLHGAGDGPAVRWVSGPWFLRDDDRMWLLPGDSPMGLRLPLDSLPWVAEADFPRVHPPDPTAKLPPLPGHPGQRFVTSGALATTPPAGRSEGRAQELGTPMLAKGRVAPLGARTEAATPAMVPLARRPGDGESAAWIVRTALCVEPREGRLHVFLPPVESTEAYLELVAAVEATAAELRMPVIVEGQTPPRDSRLEKLAVTPDPGVIEVNLHPSASWPELVKKTEFLYDAARATRLGTEKFNLDGRHTGTGGGNHILLGGATPLDSPILRRPDLLRSLLAYWQNHPSLSWLFSGQFIGPTSQAPRVDESRHDSLYELELAFAELDRQSGGGGRAGAVPPWMADRLFRHLLADASGNTHRAEFSIDKLYPAESASTRIGLVEMRAFEMPPHARMSLAQHLLLRGLVAKFWQEPYRGKLVQWGSDIHDRWMLPHFCETDFADVLRDLRDAGYPFEDGWFAPHFEFRFPRIGDFAQRDVHVELRTALEPWHVLGETPGPGGTVRYVDSSLERLQVKATGMAGDRFVITCNGRSLPLRPTGVPGEAVAGVRYRAWQPPDCLQPTIGVHSPLIFELFDTWNGRSLGGCQYHVVHPGGLSYGTFPVNAYEAESRRLSRFFALGGQPNSGPPRRPLNPTTSRYTLDLRTPVGGD